MLTATTKTAFAAMLAVALVMPASAFADVTHRAKSGVMVCSGSGNSNNTYYISNNNTKKALKITKITITDRNGVVANTWTAGDSMPAGLPTTGNVKPLANMAVNASDMAAGNTSSDYPMQVQVRWRSRSGVIATQPSIALVRNFVVNSDTVSQRASGCRPIHPNDARQ